MKVGDLKLNVLNHGKHQLFELLAVAQTARSSKLLRLLHSVDHTNDSHEIVQVVLVQRRGNDWVFDSLVDSLHDGFLHLSDLAVNYESRDFRWLMVEQVLDH